MSIKLKAESGGGSVELDVPTSVSSDIALTVPATAGEIVAKDGNGNIDVTKINSLAYPSSDGSAGQFLKTNGSGSLSFDTPSGGKVLQVVYNQEQLTSSVSTNNSSWSEITDLATSVTPVGTNSKFYVQVRWNGELSSTTNWDMVFAAGTSNPPSQHLGFNMGTNHPVGSSTVFNQYHQADANSTPESTFYSHLFTGLGNSTFTMKFFVRQSGNVTATLYTNRTVGDVNSAHYERLSSSMIVWEIAA
jgi:hypothetical protein|tara:strand:+ start:154 stop:894 length:741 start_codon:yes stop_codon:yes gene_type:complete